MRGDVHAAGEVVRLEAQNQEGLREHCKVDAPSKAVLSHVKMSCMRRHPLEVHLAGLQKGPPLDERDCAGFVEEDIVPRVDVKVAAVGVGEARAVGVLDEHLEERLFGEARVVEAVEGLGVGKEEEHGSMDEAEIGFEKD